MKKYIFVCLLVFAGMISVAQVDRSRAPKATEPTPLDVGKMESFTLENGMKIFLVQSPQYPKFTMSFTIQQPGYNEENQKAEKSIIEKAYRERKSKKYPNGEIDSIADFKGAMLTSSIFNGNLKGLKRDVDQLLDMYSDLLINPLVTEKHIKDEAEDYMKKQERQAKSKKKNTIKSIDITSYFLDSLIYGKSQKEEIVAEIEETLDYSNLSITDIETFRKERVVANNALAVVVGDFSITECKRLMNKHFGSWNNGKPYVRKDDEEVGEPAIKNRNIIVVDKPHSVQSRISFYWAMHDAFPFFEKDIELTVLNEVFGSSQMSYLYRNLREDKGLCYSIRSNIGASGGGGTGSIGTSVRNDQTDLAIENIILEMIRIRNEEVSQHDLDIAKNSLIGEFSRQLSVIAPMYYISFGMQKMNYNLPDDYLQQRIPRIYNVTVDDITALSRKYIDPFKCLIIVKGKAEDIKGKLEKFGSVYYVDENGNLLDE